MRLRKIRIRNFRCFKEEASIEFEDITALIGRNDSGKSTIMDALDLFLNDKDPDKDDASKSGDPKDLTIICEFDNLPEEVIIDDTNPTNLSSEHLLNNNGRLEIHKSYSGQLKKPSCHTIAAYAIHPTADGANDLLQLTNTNLKKRAKELATDLTGVDQKFNAPIRARIREQIDDLKLAPCHIPLNEDNAKKIWIELKKYLPAFALFKSDRESTDQDPEAQDPLKIAIKEAIKAKEAELNDIVDYVQTEVNKIAQSTLEKLKEMDSTLASQLTPTFSPQKWDGLFKASFTSDDDIPINKRGSGVKRLILLSFLRAKAEQLAEKSGQSFVIYGIEEPETSQHPNNQRMLLRALSDLSEESQVIISTHTPMLARGLNDINLRFIKVLPNKKRDIIIGGPDTNKMIADSLGVLPDNNVKLFIGVEGKHDITFLQAIATALRNDSVDILDLEQLELNDEIIFFPFSGSNLALWSSRLAGLNRPEFHLYDRDNPPGSPAKYQTSADEVNAREGCIARITKKKEIENYLHIDAISKAYNSFGINLNLTTNFDDFDDIPLEVAKFVHQESGSPTTWDKLLPDQIKEKESKAKHILNAKASMHMTKTLLDEIDPNGELLSWFSDMGNLINNQ